MAKPNIIMIILDAVRAQNMSCYGYAQETTPYINEFCAESILFKHAFSPAIWTIPSHASLFTGTYLSKHGAVNLHRYLDGKSTTLAEVLYSHGYNTVIFSNNYFISVKDFGLSRGFNIIEGPTYPKSNFKRIIHKGKRWLTGSLDCGAAVTNMFVRDFIDRRSNSDNPFFLFINYMEAHAPYNHVPKKFLKRLVRKGGRKRIKSTNQDRLKYLTRSIEMTEDDFKLLRSFYDSQISYLDFRVNEVLEILKHKGIFDNSIIIISSDHGDMIGEHNLMHHSYCVYEELIKVPLILKLPYRNDQGKKQNDLVSLIDIFPTLTELLGITNDFLERQLQGVNLPLEKSDRSREYIFSECERPKNEFKDTYPDFDFSIYDRQLLAIRSKQYKFIWSSDNNNELYAVEKDPTEQRNLIDQESEKARYLESELFKWYDSFDKPQIEEEVVELDQKVKKRLATLGYS